VNKIVHDIDKICAFDSEKNLTNTVLTPTILRHPK